MNKDELNQLFKSMTPNDIQKSKMLNNILHKTDNRLKSPANRKRTWLAIPATCLALIMVMLISNPFGSKTSAYTINLKLNKEGSLFTLVDIAKGSDDFGKSVSYVDARPELEFFIEGDNIAKIDMSTENEYIYAVDWTETQHEKFWNVEYYQHFDEERQVSIADFDLLYDKTLTMNFDNHFKDYDQIWYRWTAWNMYNWAAEDNFSHFLGAGDVSEDLSLEEELKLAVGNNGSGIGHMQLDDYPKELMEDTITITITDRDGNQTTERIKVKISNNELQQTVVTAWLAD
ncbi:hypothetical protein [Bacillus sp. FJAT-50079]|uniref:hypothetical protein n=1 Tax=Bacillus sp. FJAT-50079 TaxID=2833577 RepID=UPI001BC8E4D4|nr:hypothetical protein [Bacillus sp. FJAT-50079]MBS4208569.1 hypothetical protein [Bacillus sp. FJAT-50079]